MESDSHCLSTVTDRNVEMNLKHQYLNENSYVSEVLTKIESSKTDKIKNNKVLTVGCSVGRIPLELGKLFKESVGIDYTTRYFQMSTRLKMFGFLKLKDVEIDLKSMKIEKDNVSFMQMNPENPDKNKINECDLIMIDGYSIRKGTLKEVIKSMIQLTAR